MFFFFFNDTATTEIYTLSLHDALPISHQLRAEPRLVEVQLAVELGDSSGLGLDRDDRVDPLDLLLDLVGEPTTAPDLGLDGAAGLGDDGQEPVERGSDRALLELGVEDDHQFVMTHGEPHLLWSQRPQCICGRRVVHASRAPAVPERAGNEATSVPGASTELSTGPRSTGPPRGVGRHAPGAMM